MEHTIEKLDMAETYTCYGCGRKSSVKRTKPGQFLCNECLKVWENGKFYPRSEKIY